MPHFGSKVMGKDAFARALAFEQHTGNKHFGSRVSGTLPAAPEEPEVVTKSVRTVLAELRAGGSLVDLTAEELGREEGARKSVVKALLAEANRRGASQELVDSLVEATVAGEDDEA